MDITGRIVRETRLASRAHGTDPGAAMAEPLACVLRGVHEVGVRAGDTVVVIGCGPIGLKFIRILSNRGARVLALGKRAGQLDAARRMGAHVALNVTGLPDTVRAVRELTDARRGADCVIEAAGNATTWQWALEMVRRRGTLHPFPDRPQHPPVTASP